MKSKQTTNNDKHLGLFKTIVAIVVLFIVTGFAFKAGTMVAENKRIVCIENVTKSVESFYDSSWSVYTTIFGIAGILLGVVFPMYQSQNLKRKMKNLKKEMKDTRELIKEEYRTELIKFQFDLKNTIIKTELEKIKNEYEIAKEEDGAAILKKLNAFIEEIFFDHAQSILLFFYDLTYDDSPIETVSEIVHFAEEIYYQGNFSDMERKAIASQCVNIGYGIVYETCLKPPKIDQRTWHGLQLLKSIYSNAEKRNYTNVTKKITEEYSRLYTELEKRIKNGSEEKEYENARKLIEFLIEDLTNGEMGVSFANNIELEKLLNRQ